ncbi:MULTISPECIES: hypothetical protein [unclassified Rhodococcus (in: high G+C Gram-positive bacteria)]|uniref:hypothetical protein n=1 Tax=unclassified Rhodococcus (in: high G+C Gram-positive bacteria) TaxID=192944 RepID=UPI00096AB2CD|nr:MULTISPECIES: hypothetical protein [unclassified Rhodococcus (in: high G+C Gram-positive bacteria)]
MSNYITIRVELDDGTVAEKRAEIERIGNRRFLAYETLTAAESLTGDVVEMLIANHPAQINPAEVSS